MSDFYKGWSAIKHGTSEGQPGIYGDMDLPDPAKAPSVPSNFGSHSSEEQTKGHVQPFLDSAIERHMRTIRFESRTGGIDNMGCYDPLLDVQVSDASNSGSVRYELQNDGSW